MRLTRIFRTTGFRLAALYAGLFGLSVLLLFGIVYWIASDALRSQLATGIEAEVAELTAEFEKGGRAQLAEAVRQQLTSGLLPPTFYLLTDPDGRKVVGNLEPTAPLAGWQHLPGPANAFEGAPDDEDATDEQEDNSDHLLLAFGALLPDHSFLIVAEDTYRIIEVEEAIIAASEWALGVTALLAVLGGSLLSFGFLQRVDAINRTTQAIIDGRLSDRVRTTGSGDELDRLALNLNAMLDRVQALMDSLRQVSNDIAHDLRTPLSRLRQRLECARLEAQSSADYEVAVDEAIADTDAILKTFAALLRIAQIEAGTRQAAFSQVDLSAVFLAIADAYGAVAEDGAQTLSTAIEPGVQIRGDRELLTQMLANLVENAICHTPAGTQIHLALEQRSAGPLGTVADNGPGIQAEAREKVFRRFYRIEQSRSTPGSGLGLSLVAAIAELHSIAISLVDNEPGLKVGLQFGRPTHS